MKMNMIYNTCSPSNTNIGTKIELTLIRNKRYIQVKVPLKVLPLQTELMYGKKLLIPPKKIP